MHEADAGVGALHHVEIWVPDLARAERSWGWLLGELGYTVTDRWPTGVTWRRAGAYIVLEHGPDVAGGAHERKRPGVNHLAFWAGSTSDVDLLAQNAVDHGWQLLFATKHPFAGGPGHYAAYLEDRDGYEVELVARD